MNPSTKTTGIGASVGILVGVFAWFLSRDEEPSTPDSPAPARKPSASKGGSSVRIKDLDPSIQSLAAQMLSNASVEGIQLMLTQGLRTMEEQQALYDQGRTTPGSIVTNAKPGSSWHNFGLAFDVAVVDANGNPSWPDDDALWERIGSIGKAIGLKWGGDFTQFKDRPHFEYHPGLSLADARKGLRPA